MSRQSLALAVLLSLSLPVLAAAAPAQIVNTATVTATNGFTTNGDGTMTVTTAVQTAIPTLSTAGLAALAVALSGLSFVVIRRQAKRRA